MPQITERDASGKIRKVEWAPGEREEASRKGGLARSWTKAESEELVREILKEQGYDDPEDAPKITLLAAQMAVRRQNFAALQFLDRKSESTTALPKSGQLELQPGERCPTCGFYLLTGDEGRAQQVGNDLLRKLRESREAEQEQNVGDKKFTETLEKLREREKDE